MALSQVRSYSQWILSLSFLKCPSLDSLIVSDSEISCLTSVHAHSPRAFPQGLSSPLRSCLPMTRWLGPCEEAPLGTVLGRDSHPWVRDRVLVLLGSRGCLRPTWMHCLLSVNQGKETARGCQVLVCTTAGKIWESDQWSLSFPFCVSWHPCEYTLHIYTQRIISEYCVLFSWFICLFIPVPHHLDYLVIGVEKERPPSSFFKSFAVCS